MDSIFKKLLTKLLEENKSEVELEENSLFDQVINPKDDKTEKNRFVGLDFVLASTSIIAAIALVILMFVFFIREELFFPKQNSINSQGTITISQPAAVEHNMFLLNSAKVWANTGISVIKGDVVTITVSGSFYGSVADVVESAKKNVRYRYSVNDFRTDGNTIHNYKDDKTIEKFCVYGRAPSDTLSDNAARFGSLLIQIHEECAEHAFMNDTNAPKGEKQKIIQVPPQQKYTKKDFEPFSFVAESSGILYVMVNDVYFPKEDSLFRNQIASLEKEAFQVHFHRVEKKLGLVYYSPKDTSHLIPKSQQALKNYLYENPDMWYNDNVGEALLNIKIQRKTQKHAMYIDSCFLWMYKRATWLFDHYWITIAIIVAAATSYFVIKKTANKKKRSRKK